jgi:hypothetical protein
MLPWIKQFFLVARGFESNARSFQSVFPAGEGSAIVLVRTSLSQDALSGCFDLS